MVGMLDYLLMRRQQDEDKQTQQALMAAQFYGTPQDQVNITPRISAMGPSAQSLMMPSPQGPMPGGGVSPPMPGQGQPMGGNVSIPATATQPGQPMGGNNPQLALRSAAGMYNGPAPPGDIKAMLAAMPPAMANQIYQAVTQARLTPGAPISVADGTTLLGKGPDGKYNPLYTAPPKGLTPNERVTQMENDFKTLDAGSADIAKAMAPSDPSLGFRAPGLSWSQRQGVQAEAQLKKNNPNQPFNDDGTPNKAYQDYHLKEVGAEAAARQAAVSGTGLGADGNAIGITGNPKIDATTPGYTSAIVKGTNMTQGAIDLKALDHITGGTEPPQGRTGVAGIQNAAISNRMAEMDPGGNLAKNKTQVRSFSQSLAQQQKYLDSTQRALNTANDTLDALQEWMAKNNVNPSQFPDFNTFSNFLKARGIDPGIAGGYNAQLATLRAEFSQVLSKGGVRSVETDREAAKLIPDGLAPAQLAQVAERIRVDGMNVTRDAQNQVAKVTGQIDKIRDGNASASYEPPPTGAAAPNAKIDDLLKKYGPK